jgi:putative hydrolase of the HAD superfamily
VHIVAEKRVATYRELVTEQGLLPAATWMIGNSPRSDILPARAAGLGAVFIPNQYTWVLEHDELDLDDNGVLHLQRFTELVEHF